MLYFMRRSVSRDALVGLIVGVPIFLFFVYLLFTDGAVLEDVKFIVLFIAVALSLLALGFFGLVQTVRVVGADVIVSLGKLRKVVSVHDILEMAPGRTEKTYRNWGSTDKITFEQPVRLYSYVGDTGLKLRMASGEHLLIGTPEPEELAATIRRVQDGLNISSVTIS